jgi:hypothetical protein
MNKKRWPDLTMACMNFLFTIALIFQIINNSQDSMTVFTIICSIIPFSIITLCLYASKLYFASFSVFTNVVCWCILLIQKFC